MAKATTSQQVLRVLPTGDVLMHLGGDSKSDAIW
jgi:hypothetical protein